MLDELWLRQRQSILDPGYLYFVRPVCLGAIIRGKFELELVLVVVFRDRQTVASREQLSLELLAVEAANYLDQEVVKGKVDHEELGAHCQHALHVSLVELYAVADELLESRVEVVVVTARLLVSVKINLADRCLAATPKVHLHYFTLVLYLVVFVLELSDLLLKHHVRIDAVVFGLAGADLEDALEI